MSLKIKNKHEEKSEIAMEKVRIYMGFMEMLQEESKEESSKRSMNDKKKDEEKGFKLPSINRNRDEQSDSA